MALPPPARVPPVITLVEVIEKTPKLLLTLVYAERMRPEGVKLAETYRSPLTLLNTEELTAKAPERPTEPIVE